jgi:hypothetical protein
VPGIMCNLDVLKDIPRVLFKAAHLGVSFVALGGEP